MNLHVYIEKTSPKHMNDEFYYVKNQKFNLNVLKFYLYI